MTRAATYILALVLGFMLSLGAASTSHAAFISDLVAERAEQEMGTKMPPSGQFQVHLAEGLPSNGEFIKEFWLDPDSGQFIANVVTQYGDVRRVWGLAVLSVPIPVVIRRVQPDEIIQPNDIEMIDMAWARVHAFAITEYDDLVGMQVRRLLSPGRPVHHQSVTLPIIVSRGERVTIELSYGGLRLTAKGKAISDAHLGQEVRVVNLSSNKTITAIAKGEGRVEAQY